MPEQATLFELGNYQGLEPIGQGGYGRVWRGYDITLQRVVAIKFITDSFDLNIEDPGGKQQLERVEQRFKREGVILAQLDDPAIVKVYAAGVGELTWTKTQFTERRAYIVMEYVDGENLERLLMGAGPLDIDQSIDIIAEVLRALSYAHNYAPGEFVIHRDIKPNNIMVTSTKKIKILDFGISLLSELTEMTNTGDGFGTLLYAAPEMLQGKGKDAKPSSDIYSVGCVLYKLLTGQPPFIDETDNIKTLLWRVLEEKPEFPSIHVPGIPPELDRIILKALEKNPADRYQTADQMRTDLLTVQHRAVLDKQDNTKAARDWFLNAVNADKSIRLAYARSCFLAGDFETAASVFRIGFEAQLQADSPLTDLSGSELACFLFSAMKSVNRENERILSQLNVEQSSDFTLSIDIRPHGEEEWISLDANQPKEIHLSTVDSDIDISIGYDNCSANRQNDVNINCYLDSTLEYVGGSTYLRNSTNSGHPGLRLDSDGIVAVEGINIGDYWTNANAFLYFCASVAPNPRSTKPIEIVATATINSKFAIEHVAVNIIIDPPAHVAGKIERRWIRYGWGPLRPKFQLPVGPWPTKPVFDSIANNPNFGDESGFTIVKDASILSAGGWSQDIEVEPGRTYILRVYVENSADDSNGEKAQSTHVLVNLPVHAVTATRVDGFIRADNAVPSEIWSSAYLHSSRPFRLVYVTDSAKYYNNVRPNEGFTLSNDIITSAGAAVGYETMDGCVPPGYQYSGIATFRFAVVAYA